jgi:hypothetical protein
MKSLLWLLLCLSVAARAEFYRCVTESGATEFSDRPCGQGARKITRGADAPVAQSPLLATDPVEEARQRLARLTEDIGSFSSDHQALIQALEQQLEQAKDNGERNRVAREIAIETAQYTDEMAIYHRQLNAARQALARERRRAAQQATP